jgi:hypothetical protein
MVKLAMGATAMSLAPFRAAAKSTNNKVVVVTFGGGARDQETFSPEGQENIPHLVKELLPRSTFFSQVVNRGILGHYVGTASLATGVYETFNNFESVPPRNPTVFEYFRKDRKRPSADTWVVAPSNGFNRLGESSHRAYGTGLGAGVILPKRLLGLTLKGNVADYQNLLQDNYESPWITPQGLHPESELRQIEETLKLSVAEFRAHAVTLSSPDELSVYVARQLMRHFAPSLLWITLHDIDIAHAGAYSLYLEGIRRSDRLCAEIWKNIQDNPEYKDKTTMFVLPDFGRDADINPAGNGFQHHRTGDAASRTTWLMVLGPNVREGRLVERRLESIDLVPTLGSLMGFSPALVDGQAIAELG